MMTFCRKIVIIGGSDAAVSAALRARERSRDADITLLFADHYPNFSICGLPFYLSGEVADWKKLAHRTFDEIEREGIRLMAGLSATGIFPKDKKIEAATTKGDVRTIPYDKLIVCTGGASMVPQWPGIDLPGVFFLRWMTDGLAISAYLEKRRPSSLIIIGAGYIGMEMADAMVRRGLAVSVVEYAPSTLTTFDSRMGAVVEEELIRHGVSVFTSFSVSGISSSADQLIVHSKEGRALAADMILVAAGNRPETSLALTAGITTGFKNAICVNRKMETNLQDVYAAGDCVETYSRLLGKNIYLPLGSTAYKQGRIAGENAAGGSREYEGSLGTQSVKIFNLVAARTGLKDDEALKEGFEPLSVDLETWDHKVYYPRATKMLIRMTGDRKTRKLLGAQIIGSYGAEISKRVDTVAAAIHAGMPVDALNDLDLSYTPPLSSPWDPVQMAAQAWEKALG